MMLLSFLFIGIGFITAQTGKVTGVVLSEEDGLPVIGASVLIKGTSVGTLTDLDGNFVLTNVAPSATTLVVSYVGMKTQEVKIKPNLKIVLKADAELLDEVIVTGYGTFKKSSFTGSASNMSTEKLQDVPSLSPTDKLAGGVSGVQVTSTSGQPGAAESVRIRGLGSINATNEPLYVIDGVPMFNGNVSQFDYAQAGTSILSTLNSNDIESMTVIKDAAAASLYGSRAANGVIVITTKKGISGKTQFNAKSSWGYSNRAIRYRPVLKGEKRRDLLYLGLKNNYLNNGKSEAEAIVFADKNIDDFAAVPWSGKYTNWDRLLFSNGNQQNYEISAQGGTDKTKFYTSLSYVNQEGITKVSGFDRFTGNVNLTHTTDKFVLNVSSLFSRMNQSLNNEGTSFASPIMVAAMTASPSTYPYNEDGSYSTNFPALNGANVIKTMEYNYNKSTVTRSLSSISFQWNIWDNLKFKEVLSYDFNQANERVWWDPRTNEGRSSNGVYQRVMTNRNKINTQSQLTYNKTFAEKHSIDALVGFETEDYKLDYIYANGSDYPGYLEEIANAAVTRASSSKQQSRMTSFLGRLNYDYDNKYYASLSYRVDGSSRLASDSRWGTFWSASGSWRLSQEKFMQSVKDVLTDAKIRVSYGTNGTQPSDYYGYIAAFSYGANYNNRPGSTETQLFNPDLKWEKNYATNIGFDVTFIDRISVSFDWYNRKTKDLILDRPISLTTGIATVLQNVGSMRNRGVELEIKTTNFSKNDFYWTSSLNLGHNSNKLTKLDGSQSEMGDTETNQLIHRVGYAYNSFYGYEYAGVDPQTGKESYYINKEKGNKSTTTKPAEAQKVILGKADPKVQGGLTNFISWKNLDLNLTFTFSFGGHVYDDASWLHSNGGTYHYIGNVPSYYKESDMWQKPGDNAKLPQFVYGNTAVPSSRWIYSTNHLRLKNFTLGFSMPKETINKIGINKLRAYIAATNLFTLKKRDLFIDPETPANGIALFESPALRTVTFGLELGF